jgi:hypothetical protein
MHALGHAKAAGIATAARSPKPAGRNGEMELIEPVWGEDYSGEPGTAQRYVQRWPPNLYIQCSFL